MNQPDIIPSPDAAPTVELLAPAGDAQCARAAVANGADAVYFGLDCGFNARARAANIGIDELPALMDFLHRSGVRGYVALNTLVFSSELEQFEQTVRRVAEAGVDAVLVQDLGAARLIRDICPDLALHASTQMTLTSAETIRVAELLGIERVVLARELSLDEIRKIHSRTSMPLEAFVHGALCVAYSGQCMTSESLGGRSANRGQCAQACRLPYDLVCDGQDVDLADVKYLLSPQDLAAYALVPELIAAGVTCFKIEGRLKSPEYVANITAHYRRAIDAALAGRRAEFSPRQVEEMELSFSRGFSPGWLLGDHHKRLVPGLSSAKRGVLLGSVVSVQRSARVRVELRASIKRGDGVMFENHERDEQAQGGRVFEVFSDGRSLVEPVDSGVVELAFAHGSIDVSRIEPGQKIWKTDDAQLNARLRMTFAGEGGRGPARTTRRAIPLDVRVEAAVGQPLVVEARAESGATCRVVSAQTLARAQKHPLTEQVLCEQFGRLGASEYLLDTLDATIVGEPMVPLSILGKLRHEMVAQLDAAAAQRPERRIAEGPVLARLRSELPSSTAGDATTRDTQASNAQPALHVLCRSLGQLQAAVDDDVASVLVDFQDIRQYRQAVAIARAAGRPIYLATPRIQKPAEMGILRVLARHGSDGILARNFAAVFFYRDAGIPFIADFSLNVTNELSALFVRELGAQRITASYDLNAEQLQDLARAVPVDWLEVVVHQHMPMFHMEHCVFCAVLSPGTNKTNCGRPCDVHQVRLRDRVGMEHTLAADVGCRNTLYNAVPQSAAEILPRLVRRGIRHFRIELLSETAEEIQRTLALYRELLAGTRSGKQVWTALGAANRVGVTRGTFEERRDPLAIL